MQEEVRLRPAVRQFLALPLFALAVMVAAFLLSRRVPWLLIALTAVLMIPQVYGVKLTATHLVYLRLLGTQRVPWSAIADIELRPTNKPNSVTVHTLTSADRLVAPRRGWLFRDPQFAPKVEFLGRWWVGHRGRNWRPPPAAPPARR